MTSLTSAFYSKLLRFNTVDIYITIKKQTNIFLFVIIVDQVFVIDDLLADNSLVLLSPHSLEQQQPHL